MAEIQIRDDGVTLIDGIPLTQVFGEMMTTFNIALKHGNIERRCLIKTTRAQVDRFVTALQYLFAEAHFGEESDEAQANAVEPKVRDSHIIDFQTGEYMKLPATESKAEGEDEKSN